MRYAFRVAYVGEGYHGLARQPNVRTVEGEILRVLTESGYRRGDDFFLFSSRTDKGVHALANVFAAEIRREPKLGEINSRLRNIWIWAYAPVPHSFNPIRDARLRWYRYVFPHRFSVDREERMREAAALFIGRHDFSSFAILEDKNPVRTVKRIDIFNTGYTVMDIYAPGFLRQMVRRIATALMRVALGEWDLDEIRRRLEEKDPVPPAPPEGLILMDVHYPSVSWTVDSDWYRKMMDYWAEEERKSMVRASLARARLFFQP